MMVTPDGEWVFPDADEFYAALGDCDPDYDAVAFAVKNLGFIKFQLIENSIIEVELHPRNVELPALLSVQQQILSSQVGLFRIKYFKGTWQSEISSSPEHAIERLAEICAPSPTLATSDLYNFKRKDLNDLFENEQNVFRPIAQKWRMSFANFDSTIISLAARHQLLPRLAIIGISPRVQDPVFRFIGHGHGWVGKNYHLLGVGERVSDQPDKEYGEWVSQFYKSVATTGQPHYDVVNAAVHREVEEGRPQRRVVYERLLLPWKTPSAEVFVTLCSRTLLGASEDERGFDSPADISSLKSA